MSSRYNWLPLALALLLCPVAAIAQGGAGEATRKTHPKKDPASQTPGRDAPNPTAPQGPNEIQTHGKICGKPSQPCSHGGVFSDTDLSFVLPARVEWQRNYYSASFYAIVLRSKPVVNDETPDTDNCKQGFFSAGERRAAQGLFPARKVFASEFGCYLVRIAYTNINYKYNFLAVYGGETQAEAQVTLRQVTGTGQFPGANIRRTQVIFQNGD